MNVPEDSTDPEDATRLLEVLSTGASPEVSRRLVTVHAELRAAAARLLRRERPGHTLQPTDLVHEAWLRLAADVPDQVGGRQHFIGLAARVMRRVLVDHARKRQAAKRGGGEVPVSLAGVAISGDLSAEELIGLDDALERLETLAPRLRQVVEYRFFAGLSEAEIAELLGVTVRTVQRDWARARAWLHQALDSTVGTDVG